MLFRRKKRPREFKVGDRVKVRGWFFVGHWIQRNNRIGTIVHIGIDSNRITKHYHLHMDKVVKLDIWFRPVDIPLGYAYYSHSSEKELKVLESFKLQKPFKIWAIKPPEVKPKSQEQQIPEIWEKQ